MCPFMKDEVAPNGLYNIIMVAVMNRRHSGSVLACLFAFLLCFSFNLYEAIDKELAPFPGKHVRRGREADRTSARKAKVCHSAEIRKGCSWHFERRIRISRAPQFEARPRPANWRVVRVLGMPTDDSQSCGAVAKLD